MKSVMLGIAALGVGGAYYFGGGDSSDFERVIDRPPMSVYAAFSHAAQEGPVTAPGENGFAGRTVARVRKERGELIRYELLNEDNKPIMTAELRFAPGGEGGRATRMTAELDVDTAELGANATTEGKAAALLTEAFIDQAFAGLMNELASDVERGRTLRPLALGRMGLGRSREPVSAEARLRQAERSQRAAARPMNDAAPMADPNEVARRHINSGGAASDRWGR